MTKHTKKQLNLLMAVIFGGIGMIGFFILAFTVMPYDHFFGTLSLLMAVAFAAPTFAAQRELEYTE